MKTLSYQQINHMFVTDTVVCAATQWFSIYTNPKLSIPAIGFITQSSND